MPAVAGAAAKRVWVERLQLTDFRNYPRLSLSVGPGPVVLTGANGSGKTNLLEALSLLTSGQGLRRAPYPELARMGARAGRWRRGSHPARQRRYRHRPRGTGADAPDAAARRAAAASCASTARPSRARARSPTTSRWCG